MSSRPCPPYGLNGSMLKASPNPNLLLSTLTYHLSGHQQPHLLVQLLTHYWDAGRDTSEGWVWPSRSLSVSVAELRGLPKKKGPRRHLEADHIVLTELEASSPGQPGLKTWEFSPCLICSISSPGFCHKCLLPQMVTKSSPTLISCHCSMWC